MKTGNYLITKSILTSFIVAFTMSMANSQNLTINTRAGINYTTLWNKNIDGTMGLEIQSSLSKKFSYGSFYGVDGNLKVNRYLTISLGIIRANQNQSYSVKNEQFYYQTTTQLNNQLDYLDIPLFFRFYIKSFYLEFGPQVGFLLGAHENYDGSAYRDVSSSFKPVNFMLNGGAGFRIELPGRFSMTSGFRMGAGLTDVTKEYSSSMKIPEDASIITKLAHFKVENEDWLGILLGYNTTYKSFSYNKTQRCHIGFNISVGYDLFRTKK